MLFKARFMDGIASGKVTLAYRRWKRPAAKKGGRQRTQVGELAIDSVAVVSGDRITKLEARKAGYESVDDLLAELDKYGVGDIYRIAFHVEGEDTRIALRNDDAMDTDTRAEISKRLARYDKASRNGPWTEKTLSLIQQNPERRAGDLAPKLELETQAFKRNVRKLKELGLTESMGVGYRLSPRGQAFIRKTPT